MFFAFEDGVAHKWECDASEVGTAAEAGNDHIGIFAGHLHLFSASRPITVWCRVTWLNTEPSVYLQLGVVRASSMASEMAVPSEPWWLG